MESQVVIVNGKPRRAKKKFGTEYVTLFVDIPAGQADHFCKKCETLGKTKTAILKDLIDEFNASFGFKSEDRVKDPGSLWDRRASKHIKEAVKERVKKDFPWIFSEN